MKSRKQRRRNGKIDRLDEQLKDTVDQMLLSGNTYREIVDFLAEHNITLSRQAVCNYARKFLATTQMLSVAQDNFKVMMDYLDKYPNLDTSEAIIRIMSNSILNKLTEATDEDWQNIDIDKLLKEANSLIRATAHKKKVDIQNQTALENAMEGYKSVVYDALASKYPELYKQVVSALNEHRDEKETSNDV